FRLITATISITARYQRPGPAASSGAAPGWETPVTAPIPNVWIELRNSKGELVDGGYADQNGQRVFAQLPTTETYIPVIRARALTAAGFDLWIVNNTIPLSTTLSTPRTRYAPYSLQFSAFSPDKTATTQAFTVTATTGWNSATKTLDDDRRHSAPFSIISDVIRQQLAVSGVGAVNNRNALTILWSTVNKGGGEASVYNYDLGVVPGSGAFFSSCAAAIGSDGKATGGCSTENIPIVFLRGSRGYWNDDFDTETIVHELTHFTQRESMRSSSPGGGHDLYTYQDFSLAHHEGFATAAATMIARSPRLESYYNSASGSVTSSISDYSKALRGSPVGWFQEYTFIRFIWALFDPAGDYRLSDREIYAPYYSNEWKTGTFIPSMWAYGKILKDQQPSKSMSIDQLGTTLNITLRGNDVWGTAENVWQDSNTLDQIAASRKRTQKQTLPVITTVPLTGSVEVCSAGKSYEYNYASNRRYLRFLGDGKPRKYTVTGPESAVPYMLIANVKQIFKKGAREIVDTATVPVSGQWGYIGECRVSVASSKASENGFCSDSDYEPPEEQCWVIKVE
ncbi:MAG: hypothetical protein EBU84_14990, partial [Actinobacteria bacterium]|nr:hypothetical protein [Actinomycetota bacterium]